MIHSGMRYAALPIFVVLICFSADVRAQDAAAVECNAFEKRAEHGDARAQWQLGQCYEAGRGRSLDLTKARELYEHASASGVVEAQNDLGYLYLNGSGGPEDAVKACEYFAAASRASLPVGVANHAGCLRHGWGSTPQDFDQAIAEYERAIAAGNTTALLELFEWLDTEGSRHRDHARVTELLKSWFLANLDHTDTSALARIAYELAERHVWGIGGAPDPGTAEYLFREAQRHGDARAANRTLDSLDDAAGALRPVPCWFELPDDRRLFCAMVDGPEDRRSPEARRVSLPVVYAPSSAQVRLERPVVMLGGGGPGVSLLEDRDAVDSALANLSELSSNGYDVILVELRGVATAVPSLACAPVESDVLRIINDPRYDAADEARDSQRCLDRLEAEGIDLGLYNTTESAADLQTLREVLGYERWILLGISYGATAALSLAQGDPDGTAAVVLDSPASATPDQERVAEYAGAALDAVFAACAKDGRCNAAYPDLSRTMEDLLDRLRRKPVQRTVTHPYKPEPVRMIVDDTIFASLVFDMLYTTGELAAIPRLVHATAAGSYDVLDRWLGVTVLPPLLSPRIADGLYWSTWCPEQAARGRKAAAAHATSTDRRVAPIARWVEKVWPIVCGTRFAPPPADFLARPVAAPILVMHGEFDPVTPVASQPLKNVDASVVWQGQLDNTSHNVLAESTCAEQVVLNFLREPSRDPWGLVCTKRGPPLRWQGVQDR